MQVRAVDGLGGLSVIGVSGPAVTRGELESTHVERTERALHQTGW